MNLNLSLPTELIKDIIQLSLPTLQYSTYRERYDTLLACSLVSSVWTSIAQEELMKHLVVKDLEGLKLLVIRLKVMKEAGFNVAPITLQLEGEEVAENVDVQDILELCSTIRELFIVGCLFPTELFSSFDWSSLTNLTSLHLIECQTPPARTPSLRFPLVAHLTLCNISENLAMPEYHIDTEFLALSVVPSLTSINFSSLDSGCFYLREIPPEIAQRLTRFAVYGNNDIDTEQAIYPNLSTFTSLKSLVLRDPCGTIEYLHSIPTSLSSISILKTQEGPAYSLRLLNEWLYQFTSVVNLKTIIFSSAYRNTEDSVELHKELKLLEDFTARHGIKVGFIDVPLLESGDEDPWNIVEYLNELAHVESEFIKL